MKVAEVGNLGFSANSCKELTRLIRILDSLPCDGKSIIQINEIKQKLVEKRRNLSLGKILKKDKPMQIVNKQSHMISGAGFLDSFKAQLMRLDGAKMAAGFPLATLMLIALSCLAVFTVYQTLPLYHSLNYDLPVSSSIGAVLLAIGFASLRAVVPSWKSKVICFAVCVYELSLIWSGTLSHEQTLVASKVAENPRVQILESQLLRAKDAYDKVNGRYTDPQDKMYQNAWYFKKHVSLALVHFQDSEQDFSAHKDVLTSEFSSSAGYLKLCYRLLLIIFLMTLTHYTILAVLKCFKWQYSLP